MPLGSRRSISASSAGVRAISAAFRFSSTRDRFFAPKMGTMSSPCAITQARAVWAGLACFDFPNQFEILVKIFALEARLVTAKVVLRNILGALEFPREKAAAERAVSDK